MELLSVKLLVLTLSGVVRIFFGMVPLVLVKSLTRKWAALHDKWIKMCISFLMFFGGGILLATCFLHMMPHVRESFSEAAPDIDFPIGEVVFIAGFFLVYMLEDLVHSVIHRRRNNQKLKKQKLQNQNQNLSLSGGTLTKACDSNNINNKGLHHNGSLRNNEVNLNTLTLSLPNDDNLTSYNPKQLRETKEIFRKNSDEEIPGIGVPSKHIRPYNGVTNYAVEKFSYTDPDWWRDTVIANSQMNLLSTSNYSIATMHDIPLNMQQKLHMEAEKGHFHENGHVHDHSLQREEHSHSHMPLSMNGDEDDGSVGAEIRNLLIIVAISFHGIFEGMAIGLQTTEKDVWYLFLAVSLHECTILFCIGVELISSKTKVFRMIMYILVVSLVCPIGIAIGIIVTEKSFGNGISQALVVGSFQGLASGTLLYVTFFEIFQEEGRKLHQKYVHIIVAILGFVLMGSLELMGGHSHGAPRKEGHNHSHFSNGTFDEHDDHDHGQHAPAGNHAEDDHHHDHDHDHHEHAHVH